MGMTVPNNEPSIYFPSGLFELEPIEIGLTDYPAQIYELFNGGDVATEVEIDTSAVDDLNEANYMQPILKLLSPNFVTVQPGSIFETKWKFCPIEAKTYQVTEKTSFICFFYQFQVLLNNLQGGHHLQSKQDSFHRCLFQMHRLRQEKT